VAGAIDACTVDETIHRYHRAATELWKFCFFRSGSSHAEFIADILDLWVPRTMSHVLSWPFSAGLGA
jgi:hypothetical protein